VTRVCHVDAMQIAVAAAGGTTQHGKYIVLTSATHSFFRLLEREAAQGSAMGC
jgi:hypothetical protein